MLVGMDSVAVNKVSSSGGSTLLVDLFIAVRKVCVGDVLSLLWGNAIAVFVIFGSGGLGHGGGSPP